jgi:hypothetical protein
MNRELDHAPLARIGDFEVQQPGEEEGPEIGNL